MASKQVSAVSDSRWMLFACVSALIVLACVLPILLVVQSVHLMGISDDSVSELWKFYITLSLLLGLCFFAIVVAALKHRPKRLYNKKRYFLSVMIVMAASTSLIASAISGETDRVLSIKAEKQSSIPSVQRNVSTQQQQPDQSAEPVENKTPATQSTPSTSSSAPTSNPRTDCEAFEKSARIGSTQSDADSLYGSYLSDKALYDGWDFVYTKEQQQQKISASYQKYTSGVDTAYQRYKDEFNSNLYCFPQMPKPVIRDP